MRRLQRERVSHLPAAPSGLVQSGPDENISRREWFLVGTEPQPPEAPSVIHSHIAFPHDHSLIALDRDADRFLIQIVTPKLDQNLYLNGVRLGRARLFQPWEPVSGRYRLELRDSRGQVVDRVRFLVRGQGVAAAS